jgi:hypothetical protein
VFSIVNDIDGNSISTNHAIRVGDTVIVSQGGSNSATVKGWVSVATAGSDDVTILAYGAGDLDAAGLTDDSTAGAFRIMVYGSEFAKGSAGRDGDAKPANEPTFKSHMNKHIILKD